MFERFYKIQFGGIQKALNDVADINKIYDITILNHILISKNSISPVKNNKLPVFVEKYA